MWSIFPRRRACIVDGDVNLIISNVVVAICHHRYPIVVPLPDDNSSPIVSPLLSEPLESPASPPLVNWILNVLVVVVVPYPSPIRIVVIIEDNIVTICCGRGGHVPPAPPLAY